MVLHVYEDKNMFMSMNPIIQDRHAVPNFEGTSSKDQSTKKDMLPLPDHYSDSSRPFFDITPQFRVVRREAVNKHASQHKHF